MKKQYISPKITITEYKIEAGYALSVMVSQSNSLGEYDEPYTEERTESSNWTSEDDEGFWSVLW